MATTVHTLVTQLNALSPSEVSSFLEKNHSLLVETIQDKAYFSALLRTLDETKCAPVCEAMKAHLSSLIKTTEDLANTLLTVVSQRTKLAVYNLIGRDLPILTAQDFFHLTFLLPKAQIIALYESNDRPSEKFIQTANDASIFLNIFHGTPKSIELYNQLTPRLPTLIQNGEDFNDIFYCLPPRQQKALFEENRSRFHTLANTPKNFISLLASLSNQQRTHVLSEIEKQPNAFNFIQFTDDLRLLSMNLKQTEFNRVISTLKKNGGLKKIIQSSADFKAVFNLIEPNNMDFLFDAIQETDDFALIIRSLPRKQRSDFFSNLKGNALDFIKNKNDLMATLHHLTRPRECQIFLSALKDHGILNKIIPAARDFEEVHDGISTPAHQAIFRDTMEEYFDKLIQSAEDFYKILSTLPASNRTAVYEKVKTRLPTLIHTAKDFYHVTCWLTHSEVIAVFDTVKNKFPEINTPDDFSWIILRLRSKQLDEAFEKIRSDKFNFINSTQDLIDSFSCLPEEKCKIITATLKEGGRLATLIPDEKALMLLLTSLTNEKLIATFDEVKDRLLAIATEKTASFIKKIVALPTVKQAFLHKNLKDHLPALIHTAEDFSIANQWLFSTEKPDLYRKMEATLPTFVHNANNFCFIINALPFAEQNQFLLKIKEAFPDFNFIQNKMDFMTVIESLSKSQWRIICDALKETDRLKEIFKNLSDFATLFNRLNAGGYLILEDLQDHFIKIAKENRGDLKSFMASITHPGTLREINRRCLSQIEELPAASKVVAPESTPSDTTPTLFKPQSEDDKRKKQFESLLRKYCERIEKTHKIHGEYIDFRLFAASRSRSRDINYRLALKLIGLLLEGNSVENVFSESSILHERNKIKERNPESHGPFERKTVWSTELNKIFHLAREGHSKPSKTHKP